MRTAALSTNSLLAVIAILLALNLTAHLLGGGGSNAAPPAAVALTSPVQGQVFTRDGRIYTASDDGRTLVVWRRNMHIWEPEVFEVEE